MSSPMFLPRSSVASAPMPPKDVKYKPEEPPIRRPSLFKHRGSEARALVKRASMLDRARTTVAGQAMEKMIADLGADNSVKDVEEQRMKELTDIIKSFRDIDEDSGDNDSKQSHDETPWVDSLLFDSFACLIILLNTVAIALETDLSDPASRAANGDPRPLEWILTEAFFCLFFIVEAALMTFQHSWRWLTRDFLHFMSGLAVLMVTVDMILDIVEQVDGAQVSMNGLPRLFSMLRILKLVRIRSGTTWSWLKELRMIIKGFADSLRFLVWAVLMTVLILYISAIFTTTQIGRSPVNDRYRKLSGGWDGEDRFGTIGKSMLTLLQMMTLDGWASNVGRHVMNTQPLTGLFFVAFVVVAVFGLLNVIVAYIVEETLESARKNEDKQKVREERSRRMELDSIRTIFELADKDRSGEMTQEEFVEAMQDPEVIWRFTKMELPMDDALHLFSTIDVDGSQTLSMQEFLDGCMRLKGPAESKALLMVQAQADVLGERMDSLAEALEQTVNDMEALEVITRRMATRLGPTVKSSKTKIQKKVVGFEPMVPIDYHRPGAVNDVPLGLGNKPMLPQFPDMLR